MGQSRRRAEGGCRSQDRKKKERGPENGWCKRHCALLQNGIVVMVQILLCWGNRWLNETEVRTGMDGSHWKQMPMTAVGCLSFEVSNLRGRAKLYPNPETEQVTTKIQNQQLLTMQLEGILTLLLPSLVWAMIPPRSADTVASSAMDHQPTTATPTYGRISDDYYRLTPEQIATFHREGCVTIPDVLQPAEVEYLRDIFDRFVRGEIPVEAKDFCDMSKPFGIPFSEWSIVNCMLPTRYYPPLHENNVYERLTESIAQQLFPHCEMTPDYDQFLNKRPGKSDAVFAWHQDMAYWPSPDALGVKNTDTCTFSLALDDSDERNGCLRYVVGRNKGELRPHRPVAKSRDEGHALSVQVGEEEEVRLLPAEAGSLTIHDEWVVHGSGGNKCSDRQRRTYVLAYRAKEIVDAERKIGFTHSHNDVVNWDTFNEWKSED